MNHDARQQYRRELELVRQAAELVDGTDPATILARLWPVGDPSEEWLLTPLGRYLIETWPAWSESVVVSRQAAMEILGVTYSTATNLLCIGALEHGRPLPGYSSTITVRSIHRRLAHITSGRSKAQQS